MGAGPPNGRDAQFGSTATLTGVGNDESGNSGNSGEGSAQDSVSFTSAAEYNSDSRFCRLPLSHCILVDETDDTWTDRVLEVAGILPPADPSLDKIPGTPPLPPGVNRRPPIQQMQAVRLR